MNTLTPYGVNDRLPDESQAIDYILNTLTQLYSQNGYQKVRTPTIEYYDALEKGLSANLKSQALKFLDSNGNTLMLRPDHTTPIARLVATHMKDTAHPIKLYYHNSVFRKPEYDTYQDLEIMQSGIEYIGPADAKTDADIIGLCIESLLKIGQSDVIIDIGHTSFLEGLSADQRNALLSGNYIQFGRIPERGSLDIIKDNIYLQKVYTRLKENGHHPYVQFNKGLVRTIGYYTGILFEAITPHTPDIVASGGRYDNLIATFGTPCPAIGFAINVNALAQIPSQIKGNPA